jgi:hypothetical protein
VSNPLLVDVIVNLFENAHFYPVASQQRMHIAYSPVVESPANKTRWLFSEEIVLYSTYTYYGKSLLFYAFILLNTSRLFECFFMFKINI